MINKRIRFVEYPKFIIEYLKSDIDDPCDFAISMGYTSTKRLHFNTMYMAEEEYTWFLLRWS